MKKLKIQHANILYDTSIITGIGLTSVAILLLIIFSLIYPNGRPTTASALECTIDNAEQCMGQSSLVSSALDIVVRPAISVGVQSNVNIDITPDLVSEQFNSKTAKLSISTNSTSGYSVYMWTVDGSTQLHSANVDEAAAINSITGQVSADEFSANSWGYRVTASDSLYNPVPTDSNISIIASDTASTNNETDSYDIEFGVNIDKTLPSGQYYNSVVFSAIANPIAVSSLYDLTYMQDMTSEICENSALHSTKQLIDTRDGKAYWVAKLKDNHCWMTQNLALDLSTNRAFTPADSHVTSVYVPNMNTSATPPTKGTLSTNTLATQASWDFGKLALAIPAYGVSCGNNITNVLGQCGKVGIVDVSDDTKFKPTYTATEHQSWTLPDGQVVDDALVSVNCTDWTDDETLGHICTAGTYDSHYLIGNYYAWGAASAATTATVLASDICPKGWKIPNQAISSFADGSFANMLKQYGFVTNASQNYGASNPTRATVDGQEYYVFDFPTFYVESGRIHYQNGLSLMGLSTVFFTANSGTLINVTPDIIYPAYAVNLNDGMVANQIRCISI